MLWQRRDMGEHRLRSPEVFSVGAAQQLLHPTAIGVGIQRLNARNGAKMGLVFCHARCRLSQTVGRHEQQLE
jgi:hypothetical protein